MTRRPLTVAVPLLLVATVLPTVARTVPIHDLGHRIATEPGGVPAPVSPDDCHATYCHCAARRISLTLTDREVGRLSLWRLPLGTGKRGPDQGTMDGPLVVEPRNDRFFDDLRVQALSRAPSSPQEEQGSASMTSAMVSSTISSAAKIGGSTGTSPPSPQQVSSRLGAGTLACLCSCSASHVVQRVRFTSSSISRRPHG